MKTAELASNKNIIIKEVNIEKPKDNEVQIEILSCGICGSDVPRYFNYGAHFYPIILGHEFFGKVILLGKNVKKLALNDYVVGIPLKPCFKCRDCKSGNYAFCKNYKFYGSSLNGAFCEKININETNVFKIPFEIANKYCALFEPSTIAVHAINKFSEYSRKNVAIIGGGTIGEFTTIWSQIKQAKNSVLFVNRMNCIHQYKNIGIKNVEIINDSNLSKSLEKYTNKIGFDIVFDCVGNNSSILTAFKIASNNANVCLIGTPNKDLSFTKKEWEMINRKELSITGTWMSYSTPFPGREWEETTEALLDKKIVLNDDFLAGQFYLKDINKAFDFIESGKDGRVGRVLLINENNN